MPFKWKGPLNSTFWSIQPHFLLLADTAKKHEHLDMNIQML